MPRRGARTVTPELDLSSVLKVQEELPERINTESLFGCAAPLELEIGSGKGLFICRAASELPERCFIGVEIGKKYARFAASKLLQENVHNALIICGDAAFVLNDKLQENSLDAVHVYFPDPWWKRAHRKRRILRTDVVTLIESRLKTGGTLHFWTDVEEYFLSTLKLLEKETSLHGPFGVAEKEAENESDYRTHFERRTRLHGEKVYRAEYKRL